MTVNPRFVFIPSVRRGNGTGHLKRALSLAKRTGGTVAVPLRKRDELPWEREASRAGVDISSVPLSPERSRPGSCTAAAAAAVIDYRAAPRTLLELLPPDTATMGIDEGGVYRQEYDYLIDTFPRLKGRGEANQTALPLTGPVTPKRSNNGNGRGSDGGILIAFGGEDAAGLTGKVYRALSREVSPNRIILVKGPMARKFDFLDGYRIRPEPGAEPEVLEAPENLSSLLHRYETVITHFGLTAYEALDAGCRVVCVNPSGYHQRLARKAGFVSIPYPLLRVPERIARGSVSRRLRRAVEKARTSTERVTAGESEYLAEEVDTFVPPRRRSCPVCGSLEREKPVRFPRRSYFRCTECGITYLLSFTGETEGYGEEYFFSEYRRQYGRTYLEDLPHIRELSRPRAEILELLIGRGRILDVGCAYGGFLSAARNRGFEVYGTDISEGAVRYVRETLGIPASASSFNSFDPKELSGARRFDALTLWFVLEHFEDADEVLKRCSGLIEEGGVLALALPNGGGISGKKNRRRFLENSPNDHRTVWSPRSAARILERFGFTPERVRITGHHPERFPGASRTVSGSLLYRLFRTVSRFFRLGDTFEIYARKTGAPLPEARGRTDSKRFLRKRIRSGRISGSRSAVHRSAILRCAGRSG